MDKDFINSIQPNFDSFSGSAIWKNPDISMPGIFGISKFENFSVNPLSMGIGSTFNTSNIIPTSQSKYLFSGGADIDYAKGELDSLVYGKNLLSPNVTFAGDDSPNWHIVDAGVSFKSLTGSYDLGNLYTTSAVANDASGNLSHFLPSDHLALHSFTPQEFKQNGNVVTVTSPFGEINTVAFQRITDSATRLICGHVATGTLTNTCTGESVTICGDVLYSNSTNDFGLAVHGIAFSNSTNIITEDSCLGYAFSKWYSFRPSTGTYWINSGKLKNNCTCLHKH